MFRHTNPRITEDEEANVGENENHFPLKSTVSKWPAASNQYLRNCYYSIILVCLDANVKLGTILEKLRIRDTQITQLIKRIASIAVAQTRGNETAN